MNLVFTEFYRLILIFYPILACANSSFLLVTSFTRFLLNLTELDHILPDESYSTSINNCLVWNLLGLYTSWLCYFVLVSVPSSLFHSRFGLCVCVCVDGQLFSHVVNDDIEWPLEADWPVQAEAKELIEALLQQNPRDRLGTVAGALEIKMHPFFDGLDWNSLLRQKAEFIPQVRFLRLLIGRRSPRRQPISSRATENTVQLAKNHV